MAKNTQAAVKRFNLVSCQQAVANRLSKPGWENKTEAEFCKALLASCRNDTTEDGIAYLESLCNPIITANDPLDMMTAGSMSANVGQESPAQEFSRLRAENERLKMARTRASERDDKPSFMASTPTQVGKAKGSGTWYASQVILKGGGLRANMGTAYMTPSILQFLVNTVLDEHERAKMLGVVQEADRVNAEFEKTIEWRTSNGWYGIGSDAKGKPISMKNRK